MKPDDLRRNDTFEQLRATAARIGSDPMQIQGPGGNVSMKADGLMLVKASGTWLADALREDIFTLVDGAAMKTAVLAGESTADTPQSFQVGQGLKPSIETGFHAVLDAPVVLHTHCVATLARATAPIPKSVLDAHRLVWVDYVKPGSPLARAIVEAWRPGARGVILGNHGIIATGQTVSEAEAVLQDARTAFDVGPAPQRAPDSGLPAALEGSGWTALGVGATTALAYDPERLKSAAAPALFPDQVIFLGPAPFIATGPSIMEPVGPTRSLALLPGLGAAIPSDASPALKALADMMGEVVFRLPPDPNRLQEEEISDLLGWDAEKYRQELEKARTARLKEGPAA